MLAQPCFSWSLVCVFVCSFFFPFPAGATWEFFDVLSWNVFVPLPFVVFFFSSSRDSFDCVSASRDELHIRKMKLDYQEVGQCSKDAQASWERKLTAPGRTTVPQDTQEMYRALCQGERRGPPLAARILLRTSGNRFGTLVNCNTSICFPGSFA